MTVNGPLTAEPPSLKFDVAPMAAAARTIVTNRGPLMNYVAMVRAIPMGEQPIVIDGREASRYDVLSKKSDLRNALWGAKHRADDLEGYMSTLHNWAAGAAVHQVAQIVPPLEAIRKILDAVPTGGQVSAADLPRIREQMQNATVQVWLVRMAMTQISGGIHNFLTHFASDHDTFARGPFELNRIKQEVGKQISDDAMPLVLNPVMSGIGNAMLQVGRVFLNSIDKLSQVLGNALTGHEAMDGAASALATAASNAWTKYDAAAAAVYASDNATMSVTLRKIELATAIESWNQFATFFSESNL